MLAKESIPSYRSMIMTSVLYTVRMALRAVVHPMMTWMLISVLAASLRPEWMAAIPRIHWYFTFFKALMCSRAFMDNRVRISFYMDTEAVFFGHTNTFILNTIMVRWHNYAGIAYSHPTCFQMMVSKLIFA